METSKKDSNIKFITTKEDIDFIYEGIDKVGIRFVKTPLIIPMVTIITGLALQFGKVFEHNITWPIVLWVVGAVLGFIGALYLNNKNKKLKVILDGYHFLNNDIAAIFNATIKRMMWVGIPSKRLVEEMKEKTKNAASKKDKRY